MAASARPSVWPGYPAAWVGGPVGGPDVGAAAASSSASVWPGYPAAWVGGLVG
jgi:hypothetical protein